LGFFTSPVDFNAFSQIFWSSKKFLAKLADAKAVAEAMRIIAASR